MKQNAALRVQGYIRESTSSPTEKTLLTDVRPRQESGIHQTDTFPLFLTWLPALNYRRFE